MSLNYSERVEFEDDSAVSRTASGSKSLRYAFYSGKFTSPSLAIVNASEIILKHFIQITD